MITQLLGDLPRVELFAREQVAGWGALGNDVQHFEQQQQLAQTKHERAHKRTHKKQKIKSST